MALEAELQIGHSFFLHCYLSTFFHFSDSETGFHSMPVLKIQTNQKKSDIASIADPRLGKSFTDEGMAELMQLILQCVGSSSERRPVMSYVVMELERILEKEMNLTTVMGEGSPTVTLGSQLFKASK